MVQFHRGFQPGFIASDWHNFYTDKQEFRCRFVIDPVSQYCQAYCSTLSVISFPSLKSTLDLQNVESKSMPLNFNFYFKEHSIAGSLTFLPRDITVESQIVFSTLNRIVAYFSAL